MATTGKKNHPKILINLPLKNENRGQQRKLRLSIVGAIQISKTEP